VSSPSTARLRLAVVELEREFGRDPQLVGVDDGAEDDWGDLVGEAARLLGLDPDAMGDEEWQHFQDVAQECRATTMSAWLAHLEAAAR
jgi:hypothetical protein